jgi:hypothetical protein
MFYIKDVAKFSTSTGQPSDGQVYHAGKYWTPRKVLPSSRPGKKVMALMPKRVDGKTKYKVVHAGAEGYKHNYSDAAKKNYLARSGGIRKKDGSLAANDPWSPNYLARRALWARRSKADGSTAKVV